MYINIMAGYGVQHLLMMVVASFVTCVCTRGYFNGAVKSCGFAFGEAAIVMSRSRRRVGVILEQAELSNGTLIRLTRYFLLTSGILQHARGQGPRC